MSHPICALASRLQLLRTNTLPMVSSARHHGQHPGLPSTTTGQESMPQRIRNDAVRVVKPTYKDGWYKNFRYHLHMNSIIYKTRTYMLITLGTVIFGIGLAAKHLKKEWKKSKAIAEEREDLTYVTPEGQIPEVRLATPHSELIISEEKGLVRVAYPLFGSTRWKSYKLAFCLFDEDGNIALDDVGFPRLRHSPNSHRVPRFFR